MSLMNKFATVAKDTTAGIRANLGNSLWPASYGETSLRIDVAGVLLGGVVMAAGAPLVGFLALSVAVGHLLDDAHKKGRTLRQEKAAAPQTPQP